MSGRRACRVDANQPQIVDALRAVGAKVQPLHTVGGGVPDLLVLYRKTYFLVEIKDGAKPPSARYLTPDQQAWHREFAAPTLHVVNTVNQALEAIGAKRVADPY